ncbi:putative serine/threonine protein kinase [Blattamonas nauphoetae]|uniref:Serine/threonine protein kinase n=1 Tax=Blattamonas nauphoetae TaxID=2049346 RepID=A0ABQ9XTM2_9EUKA|nr:putative serine/threonine protein kinase [Blattamonas nauphoetae]
MGQEASKRSDFVSIKELGQGAFGSVDLVEHNATKKTYVCKSAKLPSHETEWESVEAQLEVYKNLRNPFVLKYYNSFKEKQMFYLLSEYCSKKDLRDFYDNSRRMGETVPREQTWKFIHQILVGLDYLLKKQIAHGDFKPDNVLLMENLDVRIKLSEFESAQRYGTEVFYSPQRRYYDPVAKKTVFDLSDDLWAFGVTIHYLLSKKMPFRTHLPPNLQIQSSIQKLTDTEAVPEIRDFTYFVLDTNAFTRPTTQDLLLSPHFTDFFKNSDEALKTFYSTDADFSMRQADPEIVSNSDLPQPFRDCVGYVHFLAKNGIESLSALQFLFYSFVHHYRANPIEGMNTLQKMLNDTPTNILESLSRFLIPEMRSSHFDLVSKFLTAAALFSSETGRFMKMDSSIASLHFLPTTNNHQLVLAPFSSNLFTADTLFTEAASFWPHTSIAQHPTILETFAEAFSSQISSSAQFVHSLPLLHRNTLLAPSDFPFSVVHNVLTTPSQTSIAESSLLSSFILKSQTLIGQVVAVLSDLVDHFTCPPLDAAVDKSKEKDGQQREQNEMKPKLNHNHLHPFHTFTSLPLEAFLTILDTTNLISLLDKILSQLRSNWMIENPVFVKSSLSLFKSYLTKFDDSILLPDITPPALAQSWNCSIPQPLLQHTHQIVTSLHNGLNKAFSASDVQQTRWTTDDIRKLREEQQTLVINMEISDVLLDSERLLKKTSSLLASDANSFTALTETRTAEVEAFARSSIELTASQFRSSVSEADFDAKHENYPWKVTHNSIVHVGLTPAVLIQVLGQRVLKKLGKKDAVRESNTIIHLIRWIQDAIVWRDRRRQNEWDRPVETSVESLTRNEKDEYASLLHDTLCSFASLLNEQSVEEIESGWGSTRHHFVSIVERVVGSVLNSLSSHLVPDWMTLVQQPLSAFPNPTTPLQNSFSSPSFTPGNQTTQVSVQQTTNLPSQQQPNPQFQQPNHGYQSQQLIQQQQIPNPTIVNSLSIPAPTLLNAVPPPTIVHTARGAQMPLQHVPPPTLMNSAQTSQIQPSHVPPPTIVGAGRGNPLTNNHVPQPNSVSSITPSMLIPNFITLPPAHLLSISTPFLALLSLFFEKVQPSAQITSSLAPLFAFLCRSVTVIVGSLVAFPASELDSELPDAVHETAANRTRFACWKNHSTIHSVHSNNLPELSKAWNNRNTSPSFRSLADTDSISDEVAESFNSQFSSFFDEAMRQSNAIVTSFLNAAPDKQTAFVNAQSTLADWAKTMSADCVESIATLHPTLQLTASSSPLHLNGKQVSPLAHRYYLLKCLGDSLHSKTTQ